MAKLNIVLLSRKFRQILEISGGPVLPLGQGFI